MATSVAPEHAVVEPAEVDRELRGERPRGELREREPFLVVLERDPAPALDEVALHVADERDRPTEAEGTEAEEVATRARAASTARQLGRAAPDRGCGAHVVSPRLLVA